MTNDLDVRVIEHGSVVSFALLTAAAQEWVAENVGSESWQWLGENVLVVDHRYAQGLYDGMKDEGLAVL